MDGEEAVRAHGCGPIRRIQSIKRYNRNALATIDAQSLLVVQVEQPPQDDEAADLRLRPVAVSGLDNGFVSNALVLEATISGEEMHLVAIVRRPRYFTGAGREIPASDRPHCAPIVRPLRTLMPRRSRNNSAGGCRGNVLVEFRRPCADTGVGPRAFHRTSPAAARRGSPCLLGGITYIPAAR